MTPIFRIGSDSARRLACLQLQVHRKQHDARRRIRSELNLDCGREWFTLLRDGFEGDGARGIGMTDQDWFGRLRAGVIETDEANREQQNRQQYDAKPHGAQFTTKPSTDYADFCL